MRIYTFNPINAYNYYFIFKERLLGGLFMFNLILKDLKLQKKATILISIWMIFIILILSQSNENSSTDFIFLFTVYIGCYACSNYIYQVEFKNKTKLILASLPLKSTTIVASKFAAILASTLLYTLLFYFFSLIVYIFLGDKLFPSAFMVCVVILLNSITLGISEVFNFAGDYKKSSFSRIFIFLGLMILLNTLNTIDTTLLIDTINFFSNNLFLIGILLLLISLLVSYIYYIISLKVYNKNLID